MKKKINGKMSCKGISLFIMIFFQLAVVSTVSGVAKKDGVTIAARVNGVSITEQQIEMALDEYMPRAYFHGNVTAEKRAAFRPKALEDLIKKELYLQEAKKIGLEVKKEDLKAELKKYRDKFSSEKDFRRELKNAGFTLEQFEQFLENKLLLKVFTEEEISKKSGVSEEYLKDFYARNKESYVLPDAFRVRHILIRVAPTADNQERAKLKKDAEDVLAKAKGGEDFGELAYKYSMDDYRVKGGDLGLLHKGRMLPEIESVALDMAVGQISDIIETIYGYHIVKLDEKVPGKQLSFEESRDKIKQSAEETRRNEIEGNLLNKLKANAKIEVY